MKAYMFPGQGSQHVNMGKSLYDSSPIAKDIFQQANDILGFDIAKVMFEGTEEELKETSVTQPSIFIHSYAVAKAAGESFDPSMTAGHSLGEFSALAATQALSFEDGLKLVKQRANAMQKACDANPSSMAAILGLDDETVEAICHAINGTVVPANYNSPGQIVISGENTAVEEAIEALKEKGAKRAMKLNVGGAFHSPVMEPARTELADALEKTTISKPYCPVYQNATAEPAQDPGEIKKRLMEQLTAPVKWTQSIQKMIEDGAEEFLEVGPGNVLQSLIKKIDRSKSFGSLTVN